MNAVALDFQKLCWPTRWQEGGVRKHNVSHVTVSPPPLLQCLNYDLLHTDSVIYGTQWDIALSRIYEVMQYISLYFTCCRHFLAFYWITLLFHFIFAFLQLHFLYSDAQLAILDSGGSTAPVPLRFILPAYPQVVLE